MQEILPDIRILSFLQSQLSCLPPHTCQVMSQCIFIHFLIQSTTFTLRLTRRYPLQPPHIILFNSAFLPPLSDSRDLCQEVIQRPYTPKDSLSLLIDGIPSFLHRLNLLSEDYPTMQRVGTFHLGAKYSRRELSSYTGLQVMENKVGGIVGISGSHVLMYRGERKRGRASSVSTINSKTQNSHLSHSMKNIEWNSIDPQYILAEWCYMQCIDKILVAQKQIKVFFKKYRKIKEYYQSEIIMKVFVFEEPEIFLRSVFKGMPRLQNVEIGLRPSKKHKKEELVVAEKIATCNRMETLLKNQKQQNEIKNILKELNNQYQFLIQYYSARANPYYLIFINNLNKIHLLMKGIY